MPRRLLATFVLCVTGGLVFAQQPAPKPAPRDPQRELAMSVADGFTVAAVGDCIVARPVSQTFGFAPGGVELYKGKPIFYSLGNFIFQIDLLEPVASDLYEQYKMDAATATDAEFNAMWNQLVFGGEIWYQRVVTTARFDEGRVAEIQLRPVDLNYSARGADRGLPRLAAPDVAKAILERMQRLSQPFGTRIAIEQGVGVIRPASEPTTDAR